MANVEYDLDCSGGLMEEIQKLVAPPESSQPQKKKKTHHHRRPGRSVNRDCCDSCKEGGDLLCCDRCPAAFHLQCHDPPLDEDTVPTGEWICHRCKHNPIPIHEPMEEEDNKSTCSSHSKKSGSSSLRRHVLASSQRSHTSRGSSPCIMDVDMPVDMPSDSESEDEGLHPLMKLAKAARMLNPQQMELAKEVGCHLQLPGTSKRRQCGRHKKLPHELDNGLVPLPAKVCFYCMRSCRKGPLIQCDYCPLLFHMDCLDPPLASLPSTRWMCPNHVEHTLDEKLLKSVRLSERIKLYDKYTGPVNHHTVKLQFLNKIHRQNPPFRLKVQHRREKRVHVPAAIKAQYMKRPTLLARSKDADQVNAGVVAGSVPNTRITSQEEQEEWLSSVVSLQTSIARHLTNQQLQPTSSTSTTKQPSDPPQPAPSKPTASVQPVKQEKQPDTSQTTHDGKTDSDSTKHQAQVNGSSPMDVPQSPPGSSCKPNGPVSLLQTNTPAATNGEIPMDVSPTKTTEQKKVVPPAHGAPGQQSVVKLTVPSSAGSTPNTQSRNLVISAVSKGLGGGKVLPTTPAGKVLVQGASSTSILSPRLATTVRGPPTGAGKVTVVSASTVTPIQGSLPTKAVTPTSLSSSPAIINLNNTLQACIDGSNEVELGKLDERLVQILAWQRLQQLLPQKNAPQTPATPQTKKPSPTSHLIHLASTEVRARSLLCPLTGKGQPVPMPYRSLTIGTGGDMDVCLAQFGQCNYVSPKHACIFYDEATRHYELLNYSEHGTTVDNVLYSCDFSEKAASTPQPTNVVHSVRKLIHKAKQGKPQPLQQPEPAPPSPIKPFMCAHVNEQVRHPCSCKASSSSLIGGSGAGWEGTALLHHGSYIKVGCLQFVFSIVEQAVRDPCVDKKPAGTSLLKATLRSPSFYS